MAEAPRPSHGLVDTSVVIDLDHIDAEQLPIEIAISALTLAELAADLTRRPMRASEHGGKTACNEPRPVSIHYRSIAARREPMDASTPQSVRRGARHVAPAPSIF